MKTTTQPALTYADARKIVRTLNNRRGSSFAGMSAWFTANGEEAEPGSRNAAAGAYRFVELQGNQRISLAEVLDTFGFADAAEWAGDGFTPADWTAEVWTGGKWNDFRDNPDSWKNR